MSANHCKLWAIGDRAEAGSARGGPLRYGTMTAEVDANELRDAVERLHGCPAQLVEAVPVSKSFEGRPVWHGVVHVFDLGGASVGRPMLRLVVAG